MVFRNCSSGDEWTHLPTRTDTIGLLFAGAQNVGSRLTRLMWPSDSYMCASFQGKHGARISENRRMRIKVVFSFVLWMMGKAHAGVDSCWDTASGCVAAVTSSTFTTGVSEIYLTECGISTLANWACQAGGEDFKLFIGADGAESLQLSERRQDKDTWVRVIGINDVLWRIKKVRKWLIWNANTQIHTAWKVNRRCLSSVGGWRTVKALKVFKTQLHKVPSNLVWIKCWPSSEWYLGWKSP